MLELLPMTAKKIQSVALCILLNGMDLFFGFFLVLGGWNLTNSNPTAGYACMALGLILFYFSTAIWTKRRFPLISRAVLYWVTFCCLGLSAAALTFARSLRFVDARLVFGVIFLLFVAALLSTIHLRLIKRDIPN
jgi:hypothetical protein